MKLMAGHQRLRSLAAMKIMPMKVIVPKIGSRIFLSIRHFLEMTQNGAITPDKEFIFNRAEFLIEVYSVIHYGFATWTNKAIFEKVF